MESVEVYLVTGDGTQKDVFFHVHMMHEDHVQTINGDEVLNFCSGFFNVWTARWAESCTYQSPPLKAKSRPTMMQFPLDACVPSLQPDSFPRVHRIFFMVKELEIVFLHVNNSGSIKIHITMAS
jgi:hypothetical protein